MCLICCDKSIRDYTHSNSVKHRKILFAIMRQKKINGYYKPSRPFMRLMYKSEESIGLSK